jgi:hypothetical protein
MTSDYMSSTKENDHPTNGSAMDEVIGQETSTAQKPRSVAKTFVTPAAKSAQPLHASILCPRYDNPIPNEVLAHALQNGHTIRSYFAGGLNSTPSVLGSNGNHAYSQSEVQSAVQYTGADPEGYFSSTAPKFRPQPTSSSRAPIHVSSPSTSPRARNGQAAQARATSTGGKASSAPASRRNPKDWDAVQDSALLTEVVEGQIYIMMKAKGAKVESLQKVRRSEGIPHGKTNQYWESVIENLESVHHQRLTDDGRSVPLFPQALKVEYVKGRFEKLVTDRAAKLKRLQERKPSNSTEADFSTNKGDDSEGDAPNDDADKSDATVQNNNSLLDAYLSQVQAFDQKGDDSDTGGVFAAATNAGAKRASGQEGEEQDDDLMERNANKPGKNSKTPKLPKLPGQTTVERSQSQTLEHQSRMGACFEALAKAQSPSSVEDFSAKVSSVASIVSNALSSTFSGTVKAYYEGQKASRSCVNDSGHEFCAVAGTSPPVILCKACGMRP